MPTRCCIRSMTRIPIFMPVLTAIFACWSGALASAPASSVKPNVRDAIFEEQGRATPEVSTSELNAILAKGSAIVFDARPENEFAMAHIPGSINLDAKQLGRISQNYTDRTTAMVVYSDGPFCDLARSKA